VQYSYHDLNHVYQGEIYGIQVFGAAAKLTWKIDDKKKWLRLQQLEIQTLERVEQHFNKINKSLPSVEWYGAYGKYKGRIDGAALGLLPWKLAMRFLYWGSKKSQPIYHRLKELALSDEDKQFFGYILAHEKSIEYFAKSELFNQKDSLIEVNRLLEAHK